MRIDHPHEAANRGGISNAPPIHAVRRVTMFLHILPLFHFNKAVEIVKLGLGRLSVLFPKVIEKLPDGGHMTWNDAGRESQLSEMCFELG